MFFNIQIYRESASTFMVIRARYILFLANLKVTFTTKSNCDNKLLSCLMISRLGDDNNLPLF